jgi:membrane-associated phospholipid phosphatase
MKNKFSLNGALMGLVFIYCQLSFGQIQPSINQTWSRWDVVRTTVLTVDDDAKAIIERPWKNPNRTANAVKLIGLIATDYQTTSYFQQNIEPLDVYLKPYISFPAIFDQTPFLRRATAGTDGYMYTSVTAMYAAGLLTGNQKLQEAGTLTVKAVVESYVISHLLLKTTIARNRPARPLGTIELDHDSQYPFVQSPYDFFNWNKPDLGSDALGTGFPSYHATMYFAVASTMSHVYNDSWVPYVLSCGALLYDIRGHNHWVSELVSGAVIGHFVGKVVYENYHQEKERKQSERSVSNYSNTKYEWGLGQSFGTFGPSLTIQW